jgi:hypothetical protein
VSFPLVFSFQIGFRIYFTSAILINTPEHCSQHNIKAQRFQSFWRSHNVKLNGFLEGKEEFLDTGWT